MLPDQPRPAPLSLDGVTGWPGYPHTASVRVAEQEWNEARWIRIASCLSSVVPVRGGGDMTVCGERESRGRRLRIEFGPFVHVRDRSEDAVQAGIRVRVAMLHPEASGQRIVEEAFDELLESVGVRSQLEWTKDEAFRRFQVRPSTSATVTLGAQSGASSRAGFFKFLEAVQLMGWSSFEAALEQSDSLRRALRQPLCAMRGIVTATLDTYAQLRRMMYGDLGPVVTTMSSPVRVKCDPFTQAACGSEIVWIPLLYWRTNRKTVNAGSECHEVYCSALLDRPKMVQFEFASNTESPDALSKFVKKRMGLELRHFPAEEIIARGL